MKYQKHTGYTYCIDCESIHDLNWDGNVVMHDTYECPSSTKLYGRLVEELPEGWDCAYEASYNSDLKGNVQFMLVPKYVAPIEGVHFPVFIGMPDSTEI